MRFSSSFFILFFLCLPGFGQEQPSYWIGFTDKFNNSYSIDAPEAFLSKRSLDRRIKQDVSIDSTDLPVSNLYVDSLANLGLNIRYASKWMNGVVFTTEDTALLDTITSISFVDNVEFIRKKDTSKTTWQEKSPSKDNFFDYGYARNQIEMLNGHILHNQGFRGDDMLIAVLDAGFLYMPGVSVFNHLFTNGRVIETRDYVKSGDMVYGWHTHGMAVMGILAGEQESKLVGTAPRADFILIRTEDAATEQRIEEYNWIAGAEFADSLGADVFNVSLGYKDFDLPEWNYDNTETDGETAPISIAAGMAAQKGILLVISAGNEGDDPDRKIGVPADANNVLTVGSVDSTGHYSPFSSIGYTADGRVKPDVVAQGTQAYYMNNDNEVVSGNGTSFASPIIAGLSACLWQAHPDKSNMDIINAIRQSAHLYDNPNDSLGYGIPDFATANLLLENIRFSAFDNEQLISIYPNPVQNSLNMHFYSVDTQQITIRIYNGSGKLMLEDEKNVHRTSYNTYTYSDAALLPGGLYILEVITKDHVYSQKFIKK
ncbi:MAG: S8 family peptidase [Candidatus Delongbacteria bacterium]|nr:S8 family peptidase [Candidatus Delongbacteria bacterium]